jgi:hypothetical protein
LLRSTAGWVVNDKRVERIWRREGLKVPPRQPKRGRLWLADGSCIRWFWFWPFNPKARHTAEVRRSAGEVAEAEAAPALLPGEG